MANNYIWIGENAFADIVVGTVDGGRGFWVPQEDRIPVNVYELETELESVLDNQTVPRINEYNENEIWRLTSALPFVKFKETGGFELYDELLGHKSAGIFGKEREILTVPKFLSHLVMDIRFLLAEIALKAYQASMSGNSALAEELQKTAGMVSHLTYQVFQQHQNDMSYWNTGKCRTVWDWLMAWAYPDDMETAAYLYLTSLYIDKTPPEIDDELWQYIRYHLDAHGEIQRTAEIFGLFNED